MKFAVPVFVASTILLHVVCVSVFGWIVMGDIISLLGIFVGGYELVHDTLISLLHKKFALDYIALLAIATGLYTHQYIVAGVIVLMLAGGNTLERYGMSQAKRSLRSLTNRLPHSVFLWVDGHIGPKTEIEVVHIGDHIAVRKGEVIPLDGTLVSDAAFIDESSLTGEPYTVEKAQGDLLRSGTVNAGDLIVVQTTTSDKNSSYHKIIEMVRKAQEEKSPLIRLADKYSVVFTITTFFIAGIAYLVSHDIERVLAVLVIATPCPLILATPIALMGGMNAAAKKRIIMKRLASIEVLSRVRAVVLDKTGTITLGKPTVHEMTLHTKSLTSAQVLSVAAAIERNSLHPLAKALVAYAKQHNIPLATASQIEEHLGHGITGVVRGKKYTVSAISGSGGMNVGLFRGKTLLASFVFEDHLKQGSKTVIAQLHRMGLLLFLYTGDKEERAKQVAQELGTDIDVQAECTPEDKKNGIEQLKKRGLITAMVGDGINDAPALALADVGLVFSNEEQTASSEAADIVFLGGDLSLLLESILLSKHTIYIATQSILIGIGLSTIGMIFAARGLIPPVVGAVIQEGLDVFVILNALRASRYHV